RAEPRHSGHVGRVTDDVDGQRLLRARLGEVQAGAVVEGKPGRERALARTWRRGGHLVTPADPAAAGQVDHEVQVVDGDVEELAVPGHGSHEQTLQRRRRWVIC